MGKMDGSKFSPSVIDTRFRGFRRQGAVRTKCVLQNRLVAGREAGAGWASPASGRRPPARRPGVRQTPGGFSNTLLAFRVAHCDRALLAFPSPSALLNLAWFRRLGYFLGLFLVCARELGRRRRRGRCIRLAVDVDGSGVWLHGVCLSRGHWPTFAHHSATVLGPADIG